MEYDEEIQNIKIKQELNKLTKTSSQKIKKIEKDLNKEIKNHGKNETKSLNKTIQDHDEKIKRLYRNLEIEANY